MSSQDFLHMLMDMHSVLGTMSGPRLNHKRDPHMSTVKDPFIRFILTVIHMITGPCKRHGKDPLL